MSQRYLVLDSDPFDDSLRWSLDRALPSRLPDLGFEYRFRRADHDTLLSDLWEAKETQAILTLTSDRATPAHYMMVEAGSDELVDRIAAELTDVLPTVPLEELQARAERPGDDPSALVRMALGSSPRGPDPRTIALIRAGFSHEQPLVRYRAAEAAALAPSEDLRSDLERIARDDPDESVRGMAELAARANAPRDS